VNRLRILDESYQRRSNDFVGEKQNQFCQNKIIEQISINSKSSQAKNTYAKNKPTTG